VDFHPARGQGQATNKKNVILGGCSKATVFFDPRYCLLAKSLLIYGYTILL